jgi:LPXTG-motif cell wall-anchored protein
MSEQSVSKFLSWAKQNQPRFYSAVMREMAVDGLGDWSDVLSTVVTAASKYQTDQIAKKQLDVNLERAKQGQDPVNFNALPNTVKAPTTPYSSTYPSYAQKSSNTLLYVVIGVVVLGAGFFFLRKKSA